MDRVVIVGGSVGGVRTVSELRDAGFSGDITLVDPEATAPYDRPPLSKQVLLGEWKPEKAFFGNPAELWNARCVEDRASRFDPVAHEVTLESGTRLRYDKLVIATGARPRTLLGADVEGVHVLRTMADCLALRRSLSRGGPLVVVGGGFIGAEVASSARALGVAATIVEALPTPMHRVLGDEVGELMAALHRRNGVDVRCGVGVAELESEGRVGAVRLTDGSLIPADTVVVGIGVTPNTEWLEESGIELDNGVVCDEYCAAAGVDDVYALGDVARRFDVQTGRYVRVEHWANATEQANTVAHNLVHPRERRTHRATPYFWSDQHGAKLQLVGRAEADAKATVIERRGPKERLAAIYHDGDRLLGAFTVNWPRALATARGSIDDGATAAELIDQLAAQT
ncbi:FAD/NAD(P)-binding oxidoreductase [Streptomyces sp. NPDC006872]|uniref:NAD(P)/FAD-dependent oxidoreductase n=1 Tax=Streptomyces sp. NPDC006872 TaxID=3155720 RepID=UPI0033FBD5D0